MKTPTHIFVKRVRARQSSRTVERPSGTNDGMGFDDGSSTNLTRTVALFKLDERRVQTDTGERTVGVLSGAKFPSVDVTYGDRVQYNNATYELDTVEGVPDEDNPVVERLEFERVVDGT